MSVFISDPSINIINPSFENLGFLPTGVTPPFNDPVFGWNIVNTGNLLGNSTVSIIGAYSSVTFPDGICCLVLQGTGSASTLITGFTVSQSYSMSYWAIQRNATFNTYSIILGGTTLTSSVVAPSSTAWTNYITYFTASSTSLPLTFSATGNNGSDRSVLLDNIKFLFPINNPVTVKTTRASKASGIGGGVRGLPISSSVVGYMQGISLGGPTSQVGDDSYGLRHLQTHVTRSYTEGNPNTPCLQLTTNGMWRFRWVVKPGQRQVLVRVKQVKTFSSGSRPTMAIKANPKIGLNTDLSTTASISSDWTLLGPLTFTSTGTDATWVELRNNCMLDDAAAFFDHIIVT